MSELPRWQVGQWVRRARWPFDNPQHGSDFRVGDIGIVVDLRDDGPRPMIAVQNVRNGHILGVWLDTLEAVSEEEAALHLLGATP